MQIIKHGAKKIKCTCGTCGCEFLIDMGDVDVALRQRCPECKSFGCKEEPYFEPDYVLDTTEHLRLCKVTNVLTGLHPIEEVVAIEHPNDDGSGWFVVAFVRGKEKDIEYIGQDNQFPSRYEEYIEGRAELEDEFYALLEKARELQGWS